MKGLMFVFLISLVTYSVKAQKMVTVGSGIKRSVTTIKNKTQKHSTIKRVVNSSSTKPKSNLIRTIHSVPNLESEKYKYQKGVKRVVDLTN